MSPSQRVSADRALAVMHQSRESPSSEGKSDLKKATFFKRKLGGDLGDEGKADN